MAGKDHHVCEKLIFLLFYDAAYVPPEAAGEVRECWTAWRFGNYHQRLRLGYNAIGNHFLLSLIMTERSHSISSGFMASSFCNSFVLDLHYTLTIFE